MTLVYIHVVNNGSLRRAVPAILLRVSFNRDEAPLLGVNPHVAVEFELPAV
jgi:hypothetical protein